MPGNLTPPHAEKSRPDRTQPRRPRPPRFALIKEKEKKIYLLDLLAPQKELAAQRARIIVAKPENTITLLSPFFSAISAALLSVLSG